LPNTEPPTANQPIVAGEMAVLARRYAGALYDLAEAQKQLDVVASDLRTLRTLTHENAEFRLLIRNPHIARSHLVNAVQLIAATARWSQLTSNFVALVAQNRRLQQLSYICDAFLAQLAARRGEYMVDVRAAHVLTSSQQEQLSAQLRVLTGGHVHMTIVEDKSLLGGITVKIGSRLIDASIKSKLAKLERQLKAQSLNVREGAA
jgi:F-type H+-transporting ATPase subunit delta